MAPPHEPVTAPPEAIPNTRSLLAYVPALTLALFLAPIAAGLVGTVLPAFGYLPALGGETLEVAPWRALAATPGLGTSVRLSATTGVAATALSLAIVFGFCSAAHHTRLVARARRLLAPLVAIPHVAVAMGLAFLMAPSGWLVRLASPWLTGWERPPDYLAVQDPWGLALTAGLVLKEVPFLLLMTLGALGQTKAERSLAAARSLGYGPVLAWIKCVLPPVYAQIRLPVYAVLAFSLSVVDMAIILAPGTPPPLAVQVFRWFRDPDLALQFQAAAGACLHVLIVAAAIALWAAAERLVARAGRAWLAAGARGGDGRIAAAAATTAMATVYGAVILSLVGMAIWSFAWRWRYPDALPSVWSLDNWSRQWGGLAWPSLVTLVVGLAAAAVATALTLGCLENERRRELGVPARVLWLLYVPLIVPQVGFLFGVQVLLVWTGFDGTWAALVWAHLLFVLPYVFLALADPTRAFDERYGRTALCLGASPNRVFWRVKGPMLLRPILLAFAIGFAVSVAEYLPTMLAGGGRFATLTTEAVAIAGGNDRRVMGIYALLQAALPLLFFAAALTVPAWLYRERRALQVAQ